MDTQKVRKTFKYKLKPTPDQDQALAFVARRCRELYNAALQERKEAWQKRGVSVAQTSAQPPAIKKVRPEYCDIHSQILQDVLTCLDRAFQRFFARVKARETRVYVRTQSQNRYHSFTYKAVDNSATLDNEFSGIVQNRANCHPLVPSDYRLPKTVTISLEVNGWYVRFSCADVPVRPLPATGQKTGIDLGIEAFATL